MKNIVVSAAISGALLLNGCVGSVDVKPTPNATAVSNGTNGNTFGTPLASSTLSVPSGVVTTNVSGGSTSVGTGTSTGTGTGAGSGSGSGSSSLPSSGSVSGSVTFGGTTYSGLRFAYSTLIGNTIVITNTSASITISVTLTSLSSASYTFGSSTGATVSIAQGSNTFFMSSGTLTVTNGSSFVLKFDNAKGTSLSGSTSGTLNGTLTL